MNIPRELGPEGGRAAAAVPNAPRTIVEEWTPQEDSTVLATVEQFGENWKLVAFVLNKTPQVRGRIRSGSQCRSRYANLRAMGSVHRLPRAVRGPNVRLPPNASGTALVPEQPTALANAVRSKGKNYIGVSYFDRDFGVERTQRNRERTVE